MVMDLIILGVGLTVLIARDVYRIVRRKRKQRKLKKRLREAGIAFPHGSTYDSLSMRLNGSSGAGRPIPSPRTSRNHPDRPDSPSLILSRDSTDGDLAGLAYRRSGTVDVTEFYNIGEVDWYGDSPEISGYARMPTPPPAYTKAPAMPPPSSRGAITAVTAGGRHLELPPPPPFELVYMDGRPA